MGAPTSAHGIVGLRILASTWARMCMHIGRCAVALAGEHLPHHRALLDSGGAAHSFLSLIQPGAACGSDSACRSLG
eukprot:6179158-Pleurochrysis_carterae.AAC.2